MTAMIRITITGPDGNRLVREAEQGITPAEIAGGMSFRYPVLACRINNEYRPLNLPLESDCRLDLLDMRDSYANMSYQSSLIFLYICAVHSVFGENAHVIIANSLSKGLFTTVKTQISDRSVRETEALMRRWIEEDIPFTEEAVTREELAAKLSVSRHRETKRLLESSDAAGAARLYRFLDQEELFYIHLLPSAGYLRHFELRRYRNGILLRFPPQTAPDRIAPFQEQKLLYEAFSEETHWEHLLNIDYAADLNESMRTRCREIIMVCEALHEKRIAEIAQIIHERKKRIILVAGPSSSGKTSFARRLCVQLQVCGHRPLYLGTDDYFIDRKDLIPDADGKVDFEALDAVDVNLFSRQMNDLLAGRKTDLPTFDFIEGVKKYGERVTSIDSTQPIVIEGIHALNPAMSRGIDDDEKFRIYISPLTSLNIDAHHRVPTTDARMLRRIIRDYRTRGRTASETIMDWPNVRRGEEKWIFPYNDTADIFFNSSLIYELSVLRRHAGPLLASIGREDPAWPEAQRMLEFIRFFAPVPDDSCIVSNSILREFIGGSILVK